MAKIDKTTEMDEISKMAKLTRLKSLRLIEKLLDQLRVGWKLIPSAHLEYFTKIELFRSLTLRTLENSYRSPYCSRSQATFSIHSIKIQFNPSSTRTESVYFFTFSCFQIRCFFCIVLLSFSMWILVDYQKRSETRKEEKKEKQAGEKKNREKSKWKRKIASSVVLRRFQCKYRQEKEKQSIAYLYYENYIDDEERRRKYGTDGKRNQT